MKGEINMNMFDITKEIRAILLESEIISLLIGDRVFPLMAPENTIGDYIVYQRDGYKQEYTKMGVASHYPVVFVTAVSEDYDRSNQLASASMIHYPVVLAIRIYVLNLKILRKTSLIRNIYKY